MTTESRGRDLFIVDNSVSGWTGLRYLEEVDGYREGLRYRDRVFRDRRIAGPGRQVAGVSGRKRSAKGARGVFLCYALPALDKEAGEFTEEAGTTRWYLYDLERDAILEEPAEIIGSIRSRPDTPRRCATEEKTLVDIRAKVEKHIKNTYLKRVDAPVGVKPALRCWMELNE